MGNKLNTKSKVLIGYPKHVGHWAGIHYIHGWSIWTKLPKFSSSKWNFRNFPDLLPIQIEGQCSSFVCTKWIISPIIEILGLGKQLDGSHETQSWIISPGIGVEIQKKMSCHHQSQSIYAISSPHRPILTSFWNGIWLMGKICQRDVIIRFAHVLKTGEKKTLQLYSSNTQKKKKTSVISLLCLYGTASIKQKQKEDFNKKDMGVPYFRHLMNLMSSTLFLQWILIHLKKNMPT